MQTENMHVAAPAVTQADIDRLVANLAPSDPAEANICIGCE